MSNRYRVEAKTSSNSCPFIIGFFIADSEFEAKTKALDLLQQKGYLVSADVLSSHLLHDKWVA
jgi:hypothetical protein